MKSTSRRLIVVTGTPGVGKTRFSTLLARLLNSRLLSLSSMVREGILRGKYDRARRCRVVDPKRLGRVLRDQLAGSGNLVLDSHVMPFLGNADMDAFCFVLRRNPLQLERILKAQGYASGKVAENLLAEIVDVCLLEALRVFPRRRVSEINLTSMRMVYAARWALRVLSGEKRPRVGIVDWIGCLEKLGKLERYVLV